MFSLCIFYSRTAIISKQYQSPNVMKLPKKRTTHFQTENFMTYGLTRVSSTKLSTLLSFDNLEAEAPPLSLTPVVLFKEFTLLLCYEDEFETTASR